MGRKEPMTATKSEKSSVLQASSHCYSRPVSPARALPLEAGTLCRALTVPPTIQRAQEIASARATEVESQQLLEVNGALSLSTRTTQAHRPDCLASSGKSLCGLLWKAGSIRLPTTRLFSVLPMAVGSGFGNCCRLTGALWVSVIETHMYSCLSHISCAEHSSFFCMRHWPLSQNEAFAVRFPGAPCCLCPSHEHLRLMHAPLKCDAYGQLRCLKMHRPP